MNVSPHRIALLAGAALLASGCIHIYPPDAAKSGGAQPAAAGKAEGDKTPASPYKKWDEAVKDAEKRPGLLTLHERRGTLLLEIAKGDFDKEFIVVASVARGIGEGFQTLGGMPLGTELIRFRRRGDVVQVIEPNVRAQGPTNSAVARSVELSYGASVLASLQIESENTETGTLLVDSTPLWVSDIAGLSQALRGQHRTGFNLDRERSSLAFAKGFPQNVEIEADLTYTPGEPRGIATVPDSRYVPISVHYSVSALPANGYTPRLADDRVGYFLTVHKDFSLDSNSTFFVRHINRWNLEPSDPSKAVSDAKNPVVWYLENTIPEEYRGAIRDGILEWNRAYEKAGISNAMVVKDQPEDPAFDPTDVRYNTIRWIVSSTPAFGAIGPSRVNPRTGQILDADILIEASMVTGFRQGWRTYIGGDKAAVVPNPEALPVTVLPWGVDESMLCRLGNGLTDGGALLAEVLRAAGTIGPDQPVPAEYVNEALKWVTMHEVGHTLGLRHNFRASIDVPVDKLHDTAFTRSRGLYSSVMDYAAPNIAAKGSRQGDYYSRTVGTYDDWAIEYGYRRFANAADEAAALARIAARSAERGLAYGTDEDAYHFTNAPLGVDPDVNTWDLGADPLEFAKSRAALVESLWPRLPERAVPNGESYDRLRATFSGMLGQKATALGIASKQIGGQSVHRDHRGDPGGRAPFVPVSPARQRQAMDFIVKEAFAANSFEFSPDLLNRLAPTRWSHWGMGGGLDAQDARLDYPLHANILGIQSFLLDRLTHPVLLARVQDAEMKSRDPFRLSDLFGALNGAVFAELDGAAGGGREAINSFRRNLQRALIDREIQMLVAPAPGTPEDARSLARLHLSRIAGKMEKAVAAGVADDTSRAHLMESQVRIQRSLEAQVAIDANPPRPQQPGQNAIE